MFNFANFAKRIIASLSHFIPFAGPVRRAAEPIKAIANAPDHKRRWLGPQVFLVISSSCIGLISQSALFFMLIGLMNAYTTWFLIRAKAPSGSDEREKFLPAATGVHLFLSFLVLFHVMGGPI